MIRIIIFTVVLILLLVSQASLFAQEKTDEKMDQMVEKAGPMIELLMKYDDSEITPNQDDFDIMLNKMGIMDDVQNDDSGLTKEDAFEFVNAYIDADQGKKLDIDEQKKGEVIDFLKEIEKGKQDALAIFNEATTDDKLNKMMVDAEKELYESGFFRPNSIWFTYEEFKALTLKEYPKAKEGQIKATYNFLIEQLKRSMGYYK